MPSFKRVFPEPCLISGLMNSGTSERLPTNNGQKKIDEETSRWEKYKPALKTLLPYRFTTSTPAVIPSSQSGLFSYVTIAWLTSLMWKALRSGLTKDDLWELHDNDKAERNARRLNRLWEQEKIRKGRDASFFRCVWQFGKTRFFVCIFLMLFTVIFQFLVPAWILNWILNYIEDFSQPIEIGIILAMLILITQIIRSLSFCGLWMIGIHTGLRLEGAMQFMTYEKLLRLRTGGDGVLAKAVTFCTNDQERIFECVSGGVLVIAAPAMFTLSIIYTTIVIGPWALLGNAVVFLFYPIMGGVAAGVASIRRKTVKKTNARVGLMTEILNSIRLIKMYGWEDSFAEKIAEYRASEEKELRKAAFLQSMTVTMTPMINIVASIAVFLGYSLNGNDLTAAKAWSIFSVFAAMQFTVGTLPFAVRSISEASVCFRNFQKYLDLPEYENVRTDNLQCDHDSVIVIKRGEFVWENTINAIAENTVETRKRKTSRRVKYDKAENDKQSAENDALAEVKEPEDPPPCLSGVNIEIKRGKLIGISGLTGSGKSSLLSAILGDVKKIKGDVLIRGSLAIVSQQAWIYSDTFQDNILFGSPMTEKKYDNVLEVCCLKEDLALLPDGDKTVIGNRGVTLSGGQKQRLNLARAVYSDRSIYLLDDPLSAVDSVVGKSLFQKCIKEYLRDKTILLVTHNVELLEQCDEVLFMKDGIVTEKGTHGELIKMRKDYYNLSLYAHNREETFTKDNDSPVKEQRQVEKKVIIPENTNAKLDYDKDEDVEFKDSGLKSYLHFINAGGGYLVVIVVFILFLLFGLIRIFTSVWIRHWIDAGDGRYEERKENATLNNETITSDHDLQGSVSDNPDIAMYQLVLGGSVLVAYFVGVLKGLASTRFVLRGASSLHNQMFLRIMKCPLAFFDNSPVGRIMNRFSKDMDELDARMPFFFEFVFQALIYIFSTIVVICSIFPYLSVAMIVIFAVMILLGAWLNIGVRQTKKLDNVLKSPVVGHLQSSMGGLSIIRTYNRQAVFQQRFTDHVNKHLSAEAVFRIANRWFTIRMDIVGLVAIFSTVLFGILMRGNISPAAVGFAFASIYSVCTFMPFVMRMMSELNARFTSVERILDYGLTLHVESEPMNPADLKELWPSAGEIVIDDVVLRYRPDLPAALDHVSLHVRAGEKVGIVGRTGAGKSSIMSALLRLSDIESGSIIIDKINTAELPRKTLRQEIAVIPQDPILFQGSVRYNLDPFDKYSDESLWDALEQSNLKNKISKLKKNLLSSVDAEGENFSVGEKQLICLTRAILRKNKILLLDEATASVDVETDALIQASIRTTFSKCTVLTIAHRLNTIANYDRVAVMSDGKVEEFDTPENLMTNKKSIFYSMMKASGITRLEQLRPNHESVSHPVS
ncbi:unnamed protein product [Allacma fusca]|uniref:Uncharacterized protein n=1 Tax=Allacma fusca TaxID=39272 RepID=A0A8J2K0D4_9HEXA|nr:unnamed protein product [Allacma fusca]